MTRSSGFVFQWRKELRGSTLPMRAKTVGMVLSDYGNTAGERVRPGVERLSRDCSMGSATVKRALADLRRYGWIVMVGRPRSGTSRGGALTTEYRLEIGLPLYEVRDHSDPEVRDHDEPEPDGGMGSLSSGYGITEYPPSTQYLDPVVTSVSQVTKPREQEDENPMADPIPLNGKPNPFGVTHVDPATEEEILKAREALRRKRVAPAPARKPKDDEARRARLAEVRAALDATTADAVTVETHPNQEEDEHHD